MNVVLACMVQLFITLFSNAYNKLNEKCSATWYSYCKILQHKLDFIPVTSFVKSHFTVSQFYNT